MARGDFQVLTDTVAAVIPNGGALSPVVDLGGVQLVGFVMPGTWSAAHIGFQVSIDGTNFVPLHTTADAVYDIAVTGGNAYSLPPSDFAGWRYVKVWSQSAGTGVNQGQQSTVTLVVRPV